MVDMPAPAPMKAATKHTFKVSNGASKNLAPEHDQEENDKLGASASQHVVTEPTYQYNYADVGEIAANPKRSKMNPVHMVHSSKVYNSKISIPMPSDISGVRNQWPGKTKCEDATEVTKEDHGATLKMAGDMATTLMMRKRRMEIDL